MGKQRGLNLVLLILTLFSSCFSVSLVGCCRNLWLDSPLKEMDCCIHNFSTTLHQAPADTHPRPLITHTHLDFGSKAETDWITDWHNNSRKRSGVWEAEQICGHLGWCNEKQSFLTLELCDPQTPWNPASLFLAEFPPKSHTSWNFCTHTQTRTTSSLQPALAFWLTVWTFQWGQSVLEALTKCHVLLLYVSLIQITAEDTDAHR